MKNSDDLFQKIHLVGLSLGGLATRLDQLAALYPEENHDEEAYYSRLDQELDVINDLLPHGTEIFLCLHGVANWLKNHGHLIGFSNAASSLVSFALEITGTDPIRYGLPFECFINPELKQAPTLTISVSKGGKDLITRYFVEKFGYDRVVQVSNHEEWLCVFSDPSPEIQRTNDEISHALLCKSSDLPNNVLLNLYVHEDSAVSMFKNCIKMIHKRNDPNFNPEMIRDDDNRVLQVLTSDQNCDLLQYKSKLTQHLTVHNLKQFGARSFWDICCIIGASESYERITNWGLTRYAGARNPFEYVSKSLHTVPLGQQFLEFKSILDDTDGILLFEVQYVQIIQVYTGYSYGRAEMLRRTIGAGSVDRIKEEQTLFVKSSDQNGHKLERAEEAFKFLLYNYDNLCSKSEVVARSKFAYTCAYLKVQYPEQLKFIHDRSKLQ